MANKRTKRTLIDDSLLGVRVSEKKKPTTDATFSHCRDLFIDSRIKRGLSDDTVKYYRQKLSVFKKRYEQLHGRAMPRTVTVAMVEQYVDYHVAILGNQMSSAQVVLRAVKAYCTFLVEEGFEQDNPFNHYRIIKPKRKEIATFSIEQLRRLFAQPNLKTFVGFRDHTIMTLMLDTGIRLRELTDLDVEDVHFSDRYISVKGKNGEYRNVPISNELANSLRRYIKVRGFSPINALFVTEVDDRLTRRTLQDRLRAYGKRANIKNVRVSPHTFRHTFAKMYIKNGGNIFVLQDILGHQSLEMVRVYVRLFSNDILDDHKRHNPLSNL